MEKGSEVPSEHFLLGRCSFRRVNKPYCSESCSVVKSQEVLDGSALGKKLIGGLLHSSLGDLVVEVQAHNGSVLSWGGGAWEGEHDALWDVVEGTISLEGDGLPFLGSENPIAHVVDGGVTGGSGGRELSELNDFSTTLLDARSELISGPAGINEGRSISTVDLAVPDIGVHRGRVVAPDGHLSNIGGP